VKVDRQGGQTLVVFALTLALFFTGMVALVVDLGAVFVAYNRVDSAALLAVQAGSSAIDAGAFYAGSIRLDEAEAERRCQESLVTAGVSGSCSAAGGLLIRAEARQLVHLPLPLPGLGAPVRVMRTARPAFGGRTGT
jgi:hypothetical protein